MTYRPKKPFTTLQQRSSHGARPFRPSPWGVRRKPLLRQIEPLRVYEDLLPDLTMSNDDFGWACCPFHDDRRPSLCVNVRTGWYRCSSTACGANGGHIVGFVGALLGLDDMASRRYLEERYA